MATLPTPIRAALGLAATALDEARKLPETLPQAVTTVPMIAVSTAMQASLRVQQQIAALAARGDEVLIRLHGTSAEPPSWATFDDDLPTSQPDEVTGRAAFDKIDYEHTGFFEGDDGASGWDAVGVTEATTPAPKKAAPKKAAPKKAAPRKAAPRKAAPRKAAPRTALAKKTTLAEASATEAAEAVHLDE